MTIYKNLSKLVLVVSIFVLFAGVLPESVAAAASGSLPTCTFGADPASISTGGSTTLKWEVKDADSVYINNGIGYVSQDGAVSLTGFPGDVTYMLTAINGNGSQTCTARVDVSDEDGSYNSLAPTCQISATPQSVSYNGSVILNWISNGASSANINSGVGAVQKQGSKVVEHITDTTTFKLSVSNSYGSNICNTTVYKDTVPSGPAPTCTIDIEPNSTSYAQRAVLTWSAFDSTSAQIDNNIGFVSKSGTKLISPSKSTTYTMAVGDDLGRIGYCSKTLTVAGGDYLYNTPTYSPQNPYYPQSNTISLSSIPYTGADDVLYVLAMLLLAIGSGFALYKFGKELV